MRTAAALSVLFCFGGCGQPEPPPIHRLEIWAPGLEVQIDGQGHGLIRKESTKQQGRFVLSSARFVALRKRLEPFRLSRDSFPKSELQKKLSEPCHGNYITDQGGMSVHWLGPALDHWYSIDFGCDRDRNLSRNNELRAILSLLPIPEPDGLP